MWIRTADDLGRLAERLVRSPEIAVDTEGDSLHHYPERLALIQVADVVGDAWLVDPLALSDLAPLGRVVADPRVCIVFHAGSNDLVHLKRRHGFTFARIFDTSIAARFLGMPNLGLDAVLADRLGVTLPPSRQKDDWSVRPLSEAQERYATADVLHLIPLARRLAEELAAQGRLGWAEEECAALAAQPVPERVEDPDAYARLKGARELAPRSLAVLRALHELREGLALAADRPPFKILGDATLVQLATRLPADRAALAAVPGCTPRVIERWGDQILDAIAQAPETVPAITPAPHGRHPVPSAAVRHRIEVLRQWRRGASERLGLEPGLVLPNRLIAAIAQAVPRDVAGLAAIDGVRRWRVDTFGVEVIATIATIGP
jgi:ribonuclease D